MYQTEIGGSLSFLVQMIKGERLDKIPNGSMSIVDVRDLAALEIAALINPDATGKHLNTLLLLLHVKTVL